MKLSAHLLAVSFSITGVTAAELIPVEFVVKGIPAEASQLVLLLDTAAPAAANYDDPAPAVALPVATPPAVPAVPNVTDPNQAPAGQEGARRRRRFAGGNAPSATVSAPAI